MARSSRWGEPVNFVLSHVFQEPGHPAREAPAASSRKTRRAPRRSQPSRSASGASDPPLRSSVQPACDSAARTHPVGSAVAMKQKKKKTPNKVSGTNGSEKPSEKPAPDEAPPSGEAQARMGLPASFLGANPPASVGEVCGMKALEVWEWGLRGPVTHHNHVLLSVPGGAAGAGAGLVCGTAGAGSQDAETHPEAE